MILREDNDTFSSQTRDRRLLQISGFFDEEMITIEAPLNKALKDIQSAIKIGVIPESSQNINDLSAITNIVLFGGNGGESKEIQKIGNTIIDDICNCRRTKNNTDGN